MSDLTCHKHPQSGWYWRTIGNADFMACSICCEPLRDSDKTVVNEPVIIRSFTVYREKASAVAGSHDNHYFALGLCEEAGEVAGVVKKHLFHGFPLNRAKLVEELGDTLWYLDQLAKQFGITLEEAASANLVKLAARYPNGFSEEASRNRKPIE